MELNQLWRYMPSDVLNFLVRRERVRKALLKKAEEKLHENFVVLNKDKRPHHMQEARCMRLGNLLPSVKRAVL